MIVEAGDGQVQLPPHCMPECSKAGEVDSKSTCGGFDSVPGMPDPASQA